MLENGEFAIGRKNSYDFIRLVAACLVVYSHSFALTGNTEPTVGGITLGTLGVWIFFILSGYLIQASWDQYPRFNVFFAKRFLRIFPGLVVNIAIVTIIVGIFFSSYSASEFFSLQPTLDYLNNIFLYDRVASLPGVFMSNALAGSVNASLWTLPYEFTMYLFVALLGVLGIYRRVQPLLIWGILLSLEILILITNAKYFHYTLFYLNIDRFILLGLLFFSGIVMYQYRKRIALSTKLGIVSFAVFIIGSIHYPMATPILASTLLAYALFSLGRSAMFSSISKIGDLSYGIYIYSFPIQQSIYALTQTSSPAKMFVASLAISILCALLSWHLIESRALKLKKRIRTDKYPLTQTDSAW